MDKMEFLNRILILISFITQRITISYGVDSGCGNARDIVGPQDGVLVSHPGYGRTLAPLNFCEWVLAPPSNKFVTLTIENMGNISCITQLFVYTHLGGDRYPGWNLCGEGTFPLHGTPHHLASRRGTWLRILYRGNKITDQTTGFSAKYSFQDPGCSGNQRLTAPGWFASHPGAGSWAMEAGSVCSWTLTAPYGQYVALKRGPVDLHCVSGWQTLSVHDGDRATNNSLIVSVTCTNEISALASSGRHLQLIYADRWASNSLGFNISYAFYTHRQSGCGGQQLLTAPSGYLLSHSPAGGSTYPPLARCKWRVLAPPGTRVNFEFEMFDLGEQDQSEETCNRDLLVFHDGLEGAATASHVFCNSRSGGPQALTSRFHVIDAYFSTESLSRETSKRGSGFIVKYARLCPDEQLVPNTRWVSPDENKDGVYKITVGETVHYACADGYVLEGGETVRRCLDIGVLSGTPPVCKARECEEIPQPSHSMVEVRDINMDGITKVTFQEILQYKCISGYKATSGDGSRYCMANGSISGQDIRCKAAQCIPPPDITDATIVFLDKRKDGLELVSYGEKVIYSCNHGYMELKGSSMRVCQADGTYSGKNLICAARVCEEAPEVPNASFISEDSNSDGSQISYAEYAYYTCNPGYEVIKGDTVRTCTAEGKYNGTDLVCTEPGTTSLSPSSGKLYPLSKPIALGTSIGLCFFIVIMIVLISIIIIRMRRKRQESERRSSFLKIPGPDMTPHQSVFTLPRHVTTPWDTAPRLGRRRDDTLLPRGPFYYRWPLYLDDYSVDKC